MRRPHPAGLLVLCGLLLVAGAAVRATAADAPPPARPYRIGYLEGGPLGRFTKLFKTVQARLTESGWGGRVEFPPEAHLSGDWGPRGDALTAKLAAELMRRTDLDLIIGMGTQAAAALLAVNNGKTPIVAMDVSDPLGSGLVKSETESGAANFTTSIIPDHWINMFRIFYTVMRFKRLGILYQETVTGRAYSNVEDAREVAREKGFELVEDTRIVNNSSVDECLEGLKRLVSRGIDAYYVSGLRCFDWSINDPRPLLRYLTRQKVATFAREGLRGVQLGALMGASAFDMNRLGTFHAAQIAAILSGKSPSTLSMRVPIELGLSLNLQTAGELGVDFPQEVLVSADAIVVTTDTLDEVRNSLIDRPDNRLLK